MAYEILNVTSATDIFSVANTSSNGLFGLMLIISLYIVTYITLASREQSHDSILATSLFVAILSVLLNIVGAVDGILVAPTVAIFIISLAIELIGGRK